MLDSADTLHPPPTETEAAGCAPKVKPPAAADADEPNETGSVEDPKVGTGAAAPKVGTAAAPPPKEKLTPVAAAAGAKAKEGPAV